MNKIVKSNWPALAFLIVLLLAALLLAVGTGAVKISAPEIIGILAKGDDSVNASIIIDIRLPRVLLAAVAGAGLAAVGGVMQAIFKNPLVDSYTLGMSSGAAIGAVISIITGLNVSILGIETTGVFAFLGAVLTLFFVYGLAYTRSRISINSLLLAGVAVSYFLASVISFLMMLNHEKIDHIVFWTMGSFSMATWNEFGISSIIILPSLAVLFFYTRELNMLVMGEDAARHLGVNTAALKNILLITSALIVGGVVSTGGTIAFLGLVAPHIIRLVIGSDNKRVIPYSALLGSILLVLSDTVGRILIQPAEIPVGVMTSIMGGPFFIFLLRRQKGK
ncbi:MAG TPA: iron ABC transporter permease [Bacillota bacterium]|nr:iron ABC transporter permease [Bacillota bacterium]HOR86176.1 iron ABC transporter permease [Bacillota bacterium]HPL53569.1 iron ABC transporter permease [Bacillota bacterium]